MDNTNRLLLSVADDELLRRLGTLVHQSRAVEHDLVAHIAEVDARKLYAREAHPSMFSYCTRVLHLSGAEAYLRIAAARASLKHPVLLAMLADGRLNLTTIDLLARHLTPENCDSALARAAHRSKRQVLQLIAEIAPRPDVPAVMRKLPERQAAWAVSGADRLLTDSGVTAPAVEPARDAVGALPPPELRLDGVAPILPGAVQTETASWLVAEPARATELRPDGAGRRPVVEPLSPARYKVQFTAGARLHDMLERLQALMRSTVPDGDLAVLIEVAVAEKVARLEARRYARVKAPRAAVPEVDSDPSSPDASAAVRRVASERDGYQCCFRNAQGTRCPERGRLEFHHRQPRARGGDRSPQNICLMCHAHNQYLADLDYGRDVMDRHRQSGSTDRQADPGG